jgi:hypothetical protein
MPKARDVSRRYWTLAIREDGVWAPQFGDYMRSVVADEAKDAYRHVKGSDKAIFASAPTQRAINEKVAEMNAKEPALAREER